MKTQMSYIISVLFLKRFREHFISSKPLGESFLNLNGHASHCSAFEPLEPADSHHISILCLSSHTTQALQLLVRSFFKPIKTYHSQEAIIWIRNHKERNITRYQMGELIGKLAENMVFIWQLRI
jgi:hypothetical protein